MLEHVKNIVEIAMAAASLASVVVHAFGADEKPWGKAVRAIALDVVGLVKSFRKDDT